MNHPDLTFTATQLSRVQKPSLIIGGPALVVAVIGGVFNLNQFWQSYLLAFTFWLHLGLGCLGLLMLHHLVGGRWSYVIQRLLETGALTLPLMAILFIPLIFGMSSLYPWTDSEHVAHSELLTHKSSYLNTPFFLGRAILYWLVWVGLAYLLNRWSLAQDQTDDPALAVRLASRMRRLSAIGIILFMLTATFAAYDWLMSLEPEWFSSIYGLLFMAGQGIAAFAVAIIGLRYLTTHPTAANIPWIAWTKIFNDLGNFLLGFVMIWAYFAFSQYLIIWSANLPEETVWYAHRSQGGWQWIGVLLIGCHFALPFLILLSRRAKRHIPLLIFLAGLILCMRLIDLFWLIVPAFYPTGLHLHWLDLALLIGIGGIWLSYYLRQLAGKSLLPRHDSRYQELIAYEQSEELAP